MIAVVLYVDIDAASGPDVTAKEADDGLTVARIEKIRRDLATELAQVKQRLSEV